MSEFSIKSESSLIRCEICHQSDCFDSLTNTCSRCVAINPPKDNTAIPPVEIIVAPNANLKESIYSEIHIFFRQPPFLACLIVFTLILSLYSFLYFFYGFLIWGIDRVLTILSAMFLFFPIVIILLGLVEIVIRSWQNCRLAKRVKEAVLFRLSEKGLHYSFGDTSFNLPWIHFKKVFETSYDFVVITEAGALFKFSKKLLSDSNIEILRKLFLEKFGKKAKLKPFK